MSDLREKARSLPLKPGVYLMLDKTGHVIYVGKAKALRNRVSSYFQSGAAHTEKTRRMVSHVADFDTIIATSEFEALVLECSLIKRHLPKYNILLKDGKGYPYICLPSGEPYPRFSVLYRAEPGVKTFGPYGGRGLSFQVIAALSAAFRLPTCEHVFPRDIGKFRPCLQHHLHRCAAPCGGGVSPEAYGELIAQAVMLLEGKQHALTDQLRLEMETAAEELLFEKAAHLRDRLEAIEALARRQIVVGGGMSDTDVIGCHMGSARTGIAVLHYMNGDLISRDMEHIGEPVPPSEAISAFLPQYYLSRRRCPKVILVSDTVEDKALIEQLLLDKLEQKTSISTPRRGDRASLTALAVANAREEVDRVTTYEEKLRRLLLDLQKLLALPDPPRRIEAVDISNTGQADRVGAMTCFADGKPYKKAYRQFLIKDDEYHDDMHAMEEVLSRRFKRLLDRSVGFEEPPDLLLVDGGATHAAMAARVVARYELSIPVYGMVKDSRHRTRALVSAQGLEVSMTATPALFAFVGRMQEETHRSAIEFHRKRRSRFASSLDAIPGVGLTRRNALLARFKTLKAIAASSVETLGEVVPQSVARAVFDHFHKAGKD